MSKESLGGIGGVESAGTALGGGAGTVWGLSNPQDASRIVNPIVKNSCFIVLYFGLLKCTMVVRLISFLVVF